ncbi:MAG: hypothetical protein JWM05_2252 [Acidimicrobiales bacterium]|nr:hypothetical protein [Acidimicrobiales bacterium]
MPLPCRVVIHNDPPTLQVRATWPTVRRLVADLALAGAAVGAVVGAVGWGRAGIFGLVVGAAAGAGVGALVGPRRQRLRIDADGLRIGRLLETVHVPWDEVAALGVEDGWTGRRGRTTAVGVCRRGDEWPTLVPALTFHAAGFRLGATPPADVLAPHRARALGLVAPWAQARSVPLVAGDLDDWWDRHRC